MPLLQFIGIVSYFTIAGRNLDWNILHYNAQNAMLCWAVNDSRAEEK